MFLIQSSLSFEWIVCLGSNSLPHNNVSFQMSLDMWLFIEQCLSHPCKWHHWVFSTIHSDGSMFIITAIPCAGTEWCDEWSPPVSQDSREASLSPCNNYVPLCQSTDHQTALTSLVFYEFSYIYTVSIVYFSKVIWHERWSKWFMIGNVSPSFCSS